MQDFFQRVGFPGTRIFQGMGAANDYEMSSTRMRMMQEQENEWKKDAALREMARELKTSDLSTAVPLTKSANESMLALGQMQQEVLSSPQGYINFLNAQQKDKSKGSWILGPDGVTAALVDPAGGVVARQQLPTDPSGKYSGYSAVNDIMRKYGTNLLDKRSQLPSEDRFGAQFAQLQQKYDLMEQKMLLGGKGGGLGLGGLGGLGGGGGKGGKGGGGGAGGDGTKPEPTGLKVLSPRELWDLAVSQAVFEEGIPHKAGDYTTFTPEQIQKINERASKIYNKGVGATLGGEDPVRAAEGSKQQQRKDAADRAAIEAEDKRRGGMSGPINPFAQPGLPRSSPSPFRVAPTPSVPSYLNPADANAATRGLRDLYNSLPPSVSDPNTQYLFP